MSTIERPVAFTVATESESWTEPVNRYECRVLLCPETEGGFSAHALNIAGVVSEGDSVDEALANIADAFKATIQYHLDSKCDIPWRDDDRSYFSGVVVAIERWIAVDV